MQDQLAALAGAVPTPGSAAVSDPYLDALVPVIHEFVSVLRAHRRDTLEAAPHAIDRVVLQALRDVGRGAAQALFEDAARDAVEAARARARASGKKLYLERLLSIAFRCLFGPITVVSPYLKPPGSRPLDPNRPFDEEPPTAGMRPVNDALRVRSGGSTVAVKRALADFGVDVSFDRAAAKVKEHYGLDIHRTTVRRAVLQQGRTAEFVASGRELDFPPETSMTGPPVLVEMDGSCVRTGSFEPANTGDVTPKRRLPKRKRTTEWRDLRLGFVRHLDGDKAVFVGGILPLSAVADRLRSEAMELGWTRSTIAVRVTDGGHGVRESLDRVFPTGVHILDRPHLLQHLFEAAEAMKLEAPRAREAVADWAARLARGEVDQLIASFTEYRGPGEARTGQLAGYLTRFRDAVLYEEFQRLGYPIGSGEIESAHKGHVQARMKLPGTWWTPENANRVLALRLCRENGRWDEHWAAAA